MFELGFNSLTGGIPEDVFKLGKMVLLDVQSNQLSGTINNAIVNMNNLR